MRGTTWGVWVGVGDIQAAGVAGRHGAQPGECGLAWVTGGGCREAWGTTLGVWVGIGDRLGLQEGMGHNLGSVGWHRGQAGAALCDDVLSGMMSGSPPEDSKLSQVASYSIKTII